MRLLKLELFGFKSFADKTTILFDQGVTCIVGPNGCGKSNISDSIRWVLGERSAKLLRGSSMEDVIFAGTEFRKPLSMAEVSITIDNSDRGLPIDYNEVTITRRLYRSGESEYLINKTSCRLRDIQDLILDTGIGSSSYSMIEQGRIDYILNADADERRFLIEEAAGISKYKTKKEEAIRKLERTEENRLRLNDIIQEVHKNIQYAERQAKRAQKYQEQFEKLKNLETRKAFFDLQGLIDKKTNLENEQSAIKETLSQLGLELSELQKEQSNLAELLKGILDRFAHEEGIRHDIQLKMENNNQRLQFNQEKRMQAASRLGQIRQEISQLEDRIRRNQDDTIAKKRELELIVEEKASVVRQAEELQQTYEIIAQKIDSLKSLLNQSKSESFQAASRASEMRNEFHRTMAALKSATDHKKRIESVLQRLYHELDGWQTKISVYQNEIVSFDSKALSLSEQKNTIESEIEGLKSQVEAEKTHLQENQKNSHELQARLKLIQELESQSYHDEETILAETQDLNRELTKSLRDIFTVQAGYEWALDSALEYFSRSIVAEDLKTAEVLISEFRKKKPAAMGILIRELAVARRNFLQNQERPTHPNIICSLSDVVQINAGYENLFTSFLHRVFVFEMGESIQNLYDLLPMAWGNKFISKEGITLGPDGRIFYRSSQLSDHSGHFQRSAEKTNLESQLASIQQEIQNRENFLANTQQRLKELFAAKEEIDILKTDTTIQREGFLSQINSIQQRIESIQQEIELNNIDTKEADQVESDALVKKAAIEQELPILEQREQEIRDQQEKWAREIDVIDIEKNDSQRKIAENNAFLKGLDSRSRHVQEAIALIENVTAQDHSRISELNQEIQTIEQKETDLKQEDEKLNVEQNELDELRRKSEVALEFIRREKTAAEDQVTELQTKSQTHQNEIHALEGQAHQADMQIMDIGFQDKAIHERLQQTYRIRLADLNPADFPIEEAIEAMDEQINHLREKVESIGTVNLLAIEEYEELKKRYDFLMTQQKDLDEARDSLMETIRTINRTTKTLFEETFQNVQTQFQEYYGTLFRGGHARLILVDESNPLESGIDIVVRPPGKKLQHISLLSGGEKALTAMALLFALFKIKPSPFCVLDEVDAPLDEANVDRFITVLQSFLTSSQFIIVTHNRKTIAMGNALYGVTMEEPGISKLVSVRVHADGDTGKGPVVGESTKKTETKSIEEQVNA